MRQALAVAIAILASCLAASAQTSDGGFDNALSPSLAATAKAMHATIRRDVAEAADAMAAEDFGFKPTPDVRSFAQLVGHVINANFFFCSQAKGAAMPTTTNFERDHHERRASSEAWRRLQRYMALAARRSISVRTLGRGPVHQANLKMVPVDLRGSGLSELLTLSF